jgi:hypothetical protein
MNNGTGNKSNKWYNGFLVNVPVGNAYESLHVERCDD